MARETSWIEIDFQSSTCFSYRGFGSRYSCAFADTEISHNILLSSTRSPSTPLRRPPTTSLRWPHPRKISQAILASTLPGQLRQTPRLSPVPGTTLSGSSSSRSSSSSSSSSRRSSSSGSGSSSSSHSSSRSSSIVVVVL